MASFGKGDIDVAKELQAGFRRSGTSHGDRGGGSHGSTAGSGTRNTGGMASSAHSAIRAPVHVRARTPTRATAPVPNRPGNHGGTPGTSAAFSTGTLNAWATFSGNESGQTALSARQPPTAGHQKRSDAVPAIRENAVKATVQAERPAPLIEYWEDAKPVQKTVPSVGQVVYHGNAKQEQIRASVNTAPNTLSGPLTAPLAMSSGQTPKTQGAQSGDGTVSVTIAPAVHSSAPTPTAKGFSQEAPDGGSPDVATTGSSAHIPILVVGANQYVRAAASDGASSNVLAKDQGSSALGFGNTGGQAKVTSPVTTSESMVIEQADSVGDLQAVVETKGPVIWYYQDAEAKPQALPQVPVDETAEQGLENLPPLPRFVRPCFTRTQPGSQPPAFTRSSSTTARPSSAVAIVAPGDHQACACICPVHRGRYSTAGH